MIRHQLENRRRAHHFPACDIKVSLRWKLNLERGKPRPPTCASTEPPALARRVYGIAPPAQPPIVRTRPLIYPQRRETPDPPTSTDRQLPEVPQGATIADRLPQRHRPDPQTRAPVTVNPIPPVHGDQRRILRSAHLLASEPRTLPRSLHLEQPPPAAMSKRLRLGQSLKNLIPASTAFRSCIHSGLKRGPRVAGPQKNN